MSRLAKKPILIPDSVNFSLNDSTINFKGPKGEVVVNINKNVSLKKKEKSLVLDKKNVYNSAILGTMAALIKNAIKGVVGGFEKKLEIEGIGYKALLEGTDILVLSLGFSHPVKIKIPKNIVLKVEKNIITVSGADKELVGRFASEIRFQKPPEPYKGKGIHYLGEIIRKKAGKKAVGTA